VEQSFGRGVVGCAGRVTHANRTSLCAAGFRPLHAVYWKTAHGAVAPTHHYWTNDELRYSGTGSGSCSATFASGTSCPAGQPMRVCAATATDPEGNQCNWINCGFDGGTTPDFFGGCSGNATAGTLCVRNTGCADGSVEQTFQRGIVGCAGSIGSGQAVSLCSAGYEVLLAQHWTNYRGGVAPTHNYWTSSPPTRYAGSAASCVATYDAASPACPADTPMRVCVPGGADPEGNQCNWSNCRASWTMAPNEYFGGCMGNVTAGALCAPLACADGTIEQNWNKFYFGCAGSLPYANRADLCGPRTLVMHSGLWNPGNLQPTHNYWLSDALRWNGSGPGNCFASASTGNVCGGDSHMHVCTASGSDPEGNFCNWTHCGLNTVTPDRMLGGCGFTAGALCFNGP
jgi:hypothetical protein